MLWTDPAQVIDQLMRSAGYGGNLLLNIGPDGTGRVPQGNGPLLERVGEWLEKVGDSIYGTGTAFYETNELGPNLYATSREGKLFIHVMPGYGGDHIMLDTPDNAVTSAKSMNSGQSVAYHSKDGKLFIDLSNTKIPGSYTTVIEISVDGIPQRRKGEVWNG